MSRAAAGRWIAAVLCCLSLACAETSRSANKHATNATATADGEAGSSHLVQALDAALASESWEDLRIDAECKTEHGLSAATLFSSGAGMWDRRRQLQLSHRELVALLDQVRAAGFATMRETYGEAEREVELLCRVRVEIDDAVKQVQQLANGPRSEPLLRLAGVILAVAETGSRGGGEASSLTDGLEKIAHGDLAPELLAVHVVRETEGGESWSLDLEGGRLRVQPLHAPERAPVREARLEPSAVAEIAGRLAQLHPEELPANLWAHDYTDVEIRVLAHRRSLQARQFAGMTAATHGALQERFDRLWATLDELRRSLPDIGSN
jgi:hypothetical protein